MFNSFYRNFLRILAQALSRPAQQDIQEWPQLLTNEMVSTGSKYYYSTLRLKQKQMTSHTILSNNTLTMISGRREIVKNLRLFVSQHVMQFKL